MPDRGFGYESSLKDDLESFFVEPSKDNLPSILRAEKEYDYLDFKKEWHEKSKIARHILAFANSGGGAIIIGVDQLDDGTLETWGMKDIWDEANFGNKIEKYIPNSAQDLYVLETFSYSDEVHDETISDKTFQVLFIDDAAERSPLVSAANGSSIEEGGIYIRRNTKSLTANYDEVQELLSRRLESGLEKSTAELHEELRELKTLYDEIDKTITTMPNLFSGEILSSLPFESKRNPRYPEEDYEEYVRVKTRIERRLGVENINI